MVVSPFSHTSSPGCVVSCTRVKRCVWSVTSLLRCCVDSSVCCLFCRPRCCVCPLKAFSHAAARCSLTPAGEPTHVLQDTDTRQSQARTCITYSASESMMKRSRPSSGTATSRSGPVPWDRAWRRVWVKRGLGAEGQGPRAETKRGDKVGVRRSKPPHKRPRCEPGINVTGDGGSKASWRKRRRGGRTGEDSPQTHGGLLHLKPVVFRVQGQGLSVQNPAPGEFRSQDSRVQHPKTGGPSAQPMAPSQRV